MRSVYNFTSKFESDQFIRFVFSILNVNSKRRRKKSSFLILVDRYNDLNPFRRRDLKYKPYKGYSKRFFLGMKLMILIDYRTLTLFFHVYLPVHENRIYLILEMLNRFKVWRCNNHRRILPLQIFD